MDSKRWKQIEDLFARALDLPREGRERLLDAECATDVELRSSVQELLDAHDSGPGYLEQPVSRVADLAAVLDAPSNRSIGPYQLIRVLGRGGMGEVFLANQEGDGFQRLVALKVIRPGMDSREVLERFQLERRILAQLKHPNIGQLLDAGVTDDARPYVVMEYVEGVPLDRYCDEQALEPPARIALFRQVCDAVQHAHNNLVLHRDLKPANILVTPEGVPKLLDFGIAKIVTPDLATAGTTITSMRRLTPEYAAPEQVRGAAVSVSTDVYGLGVLLFELLTGRRPHVQEGESWGELERAILTQEAPRPSQALPDTAGASTRKRRRALSGDLDTIVLKALRKEPDRRYPSVSALSDDLGRYLGGMPVHARPDTIRYRTSKFVRRNVLPLSAAGVVFLAVLSIAVLNAAQANRMAAERDEALEVRSFLLEMFGGAGADQTAVDSVTVRQLLDAQAATLEAAYGDRPKLRSEMMMVLAEGYDRLGVLEQADALATGALEIRRATPRAEDEDVAASMALLGWIRHQSGQSEAAADLLSGSLELFGTRSDALQAQARAMNDLGVVREAQGRYDEAEALYVDALALRRESVGEGHRAFAVTASNLAVIRYRKGEYAGAVDAATEALAGMREAVGPDHQRSIVIQSNLAAMRVALGDNAGAVGDYEDLLDRQERLRGFDHPVTLGIAMSLGSVLGNEGEWEAAREVLERVLEVQEVRLGPDNPNLGIVLLRLGQALNGRSLWSQADSVLTRGLALIRSGVGEDHPRIAEGLESLADVREMIDPAESEALHRRAVGILERVSGPDHPATGEARMRLADRLTRFGGRVDDALEEYRAAHLIFTAQLPPEHRSIHRSRVRMALMEWHRGEYAAADSLLGVAHTAFQAGGASPVTVALADSLTELMAAR